MQYSLYGARWWLARSFTVGDMGRSVVMWKTLNKASCEALRGEGVLWTRPPPFLPPLARRRFWVFFQLRYYARNL